MMCNFNAESRQLTLGNWGSVQFGTIKVNICIQEMYYIMPISQNVHYEEVKSRC